MSGVVAQQYFTRDRVCDTDKSGRLTLCRLRSVGYVELAPHGAPPMPKVSQTSFRSSEANNLLQQRNLPEVDSTVSRNVRRSGNAAGFGNYPRPVRLTPMPLSLPANDYDVASSACETEWEMAKPASEFESVCGFFRRSLRLPIVAWHQDHRFTASSNQKTCRSGVHRGTGEQGQPDQLSTIEVEEDT